MDQEHQVLELEPMAEGIPLEIVLSVGDHYSSPVAENPGEKHSFALIGQGGLLTEEAGIYQNLEGFDTALNQFKTMEYTIIAP
ncbi:MAG: hypothetical protein PF479_05775 [Oceanispirochaeta sp.]|nr:hypothetical protein [Oceanispirochaeta sp.]